MARPLETRKMEKLIERWMRKTASQARLMKKHTEFFTRLMLATFDAWKEAIDKLEKRLELEAEIIPEAKELKEWLEDLKKHIEEVRKDYEDFSKKFLELLTSIIERATARYKRPPSWLYW